MSSCIEQIDLAEISIDNLLVVDGLITDQHTKQQIKLSRTVPLNSSVSFLPESQATVSVEDDADNIFEFQEITTGLYESINEFGAIFDAKYQLNITTSSGDIYQSTMVGLISTPPIDSIYVEFESFGSPSNPFGGYFNFYLDSRNNPDNNKYYKWIWSSVAKVEVPNPSRWLWTSGNDFILRELGSINNSQQVQFCWDADSNKVLNIKGLLEGESEIVRQPIHRFHSDSGSMKVKYSIDVTQYALSSESYQFWNLIEESTNQGFLFDVQVGTIPGNVLSLSDNTEPVLGFFEAVQVQKSRKFYSARDFHEAGYREQTYFIVDCENEEPLITDLDQLGAFMEDHSYNYTLCYFITAPPSAAFCRIECADCLYHANSNKEPDFW